ncbi:MAG: ExbD/TolR family protein, partial [Lysobacter sp.]
QSNAKSLQQKKDPIVVSVDAAGNYFLAVKAGSNEAVTREALAAKVRAIVSQNKEIQVLIGGDAKASYQIISDTIDLLQLAGVDKVSLISVPKQVAAK